MKVLNRFLTEYSEFWRPIGLKLGLESAVLNLVEADHRLQQRECFRLTLQKWLQQDVQATWYKLELAITNAKREYHGLDALIASKSSSCNQNVLQIFTSATRINSNFFSSKNVGSHKHYIFD